MAVLHFQDAVEHHHKWLDELVAFLTDQPCDLHIHEIVRDDMCKIGAWLHGDGQEFAHLNVFQTVKDLHKQIHDIATQAVNAKHADDHDLVQRLLDQIMDVKHDMFMSWHDLNMFIGSYE